MIVDISKFSRALAYSPLAIGLALATCPGPALAEEGPSVQQIIEALKPRQEVAPSAERTRNLDLGPPSLSATGPNQEAQFIDTFRNRPTRSITLGEREGLEKYTPGKPAIDFEINFDLGSARIGRSAAPVAARLGEALFSLPLSIGGAILALLVTGKQLTIPVWIGIMMLMGIVTKNAILLVDFAIESIHHGMERDSAIIDAGRKRARPIIMTTIAMVAGMLPSAFAFGAGGEFRSPMAVSVIGGLLVSTALSLVFVPAMFAMMDDVARLTRRLGKTVLTSAHANPRPGLAVRAPRRSFMRANYDRVHPRRGRALQATIQRES